MTMSNATPPPVLDGARVVAYAAVDNGVTYTGRSMLYVNGKLLGAVPHLAICQTFEARNVLLIFCDEKWRSVGVTECTSVQEAKERAEIEYRGASAMWVEADVSEEEAKRYMEECWGDQSCSFCGKQPEQIEHMFQSAHARICNECVSAFYQSVNT